MNEASSPHARMAFTGERFTPETPGEIWYEHWHRYCAVLELARGRNVLDAACGEGYGSALLADAAARVTGVDVSGEAIAHARLRYADRPRLDFSCASVTQLPFADASFDLVVSFETIEHLAEQETMLAEFRRVLRPEGILVISSPNKPVYSEERDYHNEFHVRELTREELAQSLSKGFPRQRWYGQRLMFHSLLWPEDGQSSAALQAFALDDDRVAKLDAPAPSMYYIVVCGAESVELPALAPSIFADRELSIYREFERATKAERTVYAMYLEHDRHLRELQAKVAELLEAQQRSEG